MTDPVIEHLKGRTLAVRQPTTTHEVSLIELDTVLTNFDHGHNAIRIEQRIETSPLYRMGRNAMHGVQRVLGRTIREEDLPTLVTTQLEHARQLNQLLDRMQLFYEGVIYDNQQRLERVVESWGQNARKLEVAEEAYENQVQLTSQLEIALHEADGIDDTVAARIKHSRQQSTTNALGVERDVYAQRADHLKKQSDLFEVQATLLQYFHGAIIKIKEGSEMYVDTLDASLTAWSSIRNLSTVVGHVDRTMGALQQYHDLINTSYAQGVRGVLQTTNDQQVSDRIPNAIGMVQSLLSEARYVVGQRRLQ